MTSAFTTTSASFDTHDGNQGCLSLANLSPPLWDYEQRSTRAASLDADAAHSQSTSPSSTLFDASATATTLAPGFNPANNLTAPGLDPFFDFDFNPAQADPQAFFDDAISWSTIKGEATHNVGDANVRGSYPLTPTLTASVHPTPRGGSSEPVSRPDSGNISLSVSPQLLQKSSFESVSVPAVVEPLNHMFHSGNSSQTGLDNMSSNWMQKPANLAHQSPRVTVSEYRDGSPQSRPVQRTVGDYFNDAHGGYQSAGHFISPRHETGTVSNRRLSLDDCDDDTPVSRRRLEHRSRSAQETVSINQNEAKRRLQDSNDMVDKWVSQSQAKACMPQEISVVDTQAVEQARRVVHGDVPFGQLTENRYVAGQTYYNQDSGSSHQLNEIDRQIIAGDVWGDRPLIHQILPSTNQPPTSQAAIDKYQRQCADNDSTISRSATWGTRRRSLPSVFEADNEGILSGNFLKKLIISSRGNGDKRSRSGSLLSDIYGFVRRPSVGSRKRSRSRSRNGKCEDEASGQQGVETQGGGKSRLSPPTRTPSWGKKAVPNINSALVSMGHVSAAIGATHSRSGSISGKTLSSTLTVRSSLQRPRSVSAAASTENTSNVAGLWKRSRGPSMPPSAPVSNAGANAEEEEDDDDDELHDDHDLRMMDAGVMKQFTPDVAGFGQQVLSLNPNLGVENSYLLDRITHQQMLRYNSLVKAKDEHFGLGNKCPCGSLCLALGGSAKTADLQSDSPRAGDSISAPSSDPDDGTAGEGVMSQESFPPGIPMPPTSHFPAELECQLCFQRKKCVKPSDWTKHVHEDVQPFTCTWDNCRDAKMFKRKADWIRHENEGHRHLEWWTCDIDPCRHTCYRRDNFLQHLVREHKFAEPRIKTKAALKRASGLDPAWAKVEQCHRETSKQPQEEPCRFCKRVFYTWRDLTVHLAKHMEQVSLPVLHAVAAKVPRAKANGESGLGNSVDGAQKQCSGVAAAVGQEQGHFGNGSRQPLEKNFSHGLLAEGPLQCSVGPEQQHVMPMVSSCEYQYGHEGAGFASPFGPVDEGIDECVLATSQLSQAQNSVKAPQLGNLMPDFGENELEPFPLFDALGLEATTALQSQINEHQMMTMGHGAHQT
ncbi:hypothetical protein CDD82_6717 [Ophiocordyceps australis]|uniref:C2H2-type domain-containing protein n=1 Tax=Ophiocordyceps australis TaxID=1399860 RepID=A0A2C5XG35_9HYPO|nr:hypothetical protein CDD82_6717 [Ophiocordyceps australis]